MKFVCDSCHAQYMISDDKVGANGVKVRCKKCSNIIVVKKVAEPDPTAVMQATKPEAAPFAGLDTDEIGQAFDNVLSSGPHKKKDFPIGGTGEHTVPAGPGFPALASAFDSDHESTMVMDRSLVASLAAETEDRTALNQIPDAIKAQGVVGDAKSGANGANGHANGANGTKNARPASTGGVNVAAIPQDDWYVAIDEEQKGPMTLDTVKGHWEKGKVTPDSLVWRNGYDDWKPLSSIPELVKVLTPIPTPRRAPEKSSEAQPPAGATASGPQVPWQGPAPAPAAVPDPDEVDWKPAAASALASLVAEEMEALAKPAPKPRAEPVGVGTMTNIGIPAPSEGAGDQADAAASPQPSSPRSSRAPVPPSSNPADAADFGAAPAPMGRASGFTPPPPEAPVYAPPPVYSQPPSSSNAKYVVIGVAVLMVCLTAVGITYLVAGKGSTPAPAPAPVAVATSAEPPRTEPVHAAPPVEKPAPAATQPAPAPANPPSTAAAAPAATQPAPATASATPPAPAVNPAPTTSAPVAAAPAPQQAGPAAQGTRYGKRNGKRGMVAEGAAPAAAAATPTAPAEKPSSDADILSAGSRSKIDDEFEKELSGSKAEAPAPSKKSKSVYIPPSNLPDQLGQGDIMAVVAGHRQQILACVQQQRAKDPDASGSVTMHWQIERSGGVSRIGVATSEFKGSPMGTCMSKLISTWKFPQFSGNPMPIDFPFKF